MIGTDLADLWPRSFIKQWVLAHVPMRRCSACDGRFIGDGADDYRLCPSCERDEQEFIETVCAQTELVNMDEFLEVQENFVRRAYDA